MPRLSRVEGSEPTAEIVGDLAHVHPMTVNVATKSRHFSQVRTPVPGALGSHATR
jgi:hypothetical protein